MMSAQASDDSAITNINLNRKGHIPESCQIAATCEISDETHLEDHVILEKNVILIGDVNLHNHVVIRQDSILKGPIEVMAQAIIAKGVQIGLTEASGDHVMRKTQIGKEARIGYEAAIVRGVALGDFCRIRAHSMVMGDVPAYGLVGGDPAVLENYICPNCASLLQPFGRIGRVFEFGCQQCKEVKIRLILSDDGPKPGYILLPGSKRGAAVSQYGYDPNWQNDIEMRW